MDPQDFDIDKIVSINISGGYTDIEPVLVRKLEVHLMQHFYRWRH